MGPVTMAAQFDPIVGRYVHVTIDGRANRIYFEEAGQGIPLVCLHTAGADGRQFRHMMMDAAITESFRVSPSTCQGTANQTRRRAGSARNIY